MAAVNDQGLPGQRGHHQRTKSSVLRSFMMHRRNNSQGSGLATALLVPDQGGGPLEETSGNRQQLNPQAQTIAQAEKHPISHGSAAGGGYGNRTPDVSSSPAKKKKLTCETSTAATGILDSSSINEENEDAANLPPSTGKKNRSRSTTNLVGLLSRPKSLRNLRGVASRDADTETDRVEEEKARGRGRSRSDDKKRDKSRRNIKDGRGEDNGTPANNTASGSLPDTVTPTQVTPIYAQFCSTSKASGKDDLAIGQKPLSAGAPAPVNHQGSSTKPRPQSFHPASAASASRPKLMSAFSSTRQMQQVPGSSPTTLGVSTPSSSEAAMDPNDIDTHLEALLDRRNIPEHQRYKMRSLANAIKMELIRQDWAEERSKRQQHQQQPCDRPQSHDSARSTNASPDVANGSSLAPAQVDVSSSGKDSKKHSRVKSMTLSKVTRGRSRDRGITDTGKRTKSPGSPLKKRAEGTLSRHLRSKSTESFVNVGANGLTSSSGAASPAFGSTGNAITGFFSKAKGPQQNSPADFVAYLHTVQAPEKVEVGKLHKLRLLLRNETVAWIEDFIGQGGMEEVVGLLRRIMAVEWREEHEDALLHENLLCLKALCTTGLALQYLHSIHATLFPALIHMIFDPDKKGPSEFTTRNIITWVLFTYIQNAPVHERPERAQTVLGYLRDSEREEDNRPVSFVLDMHKDRPYRVWCKEVVSVTKEVFWIFLHHLNVVSLPAAANGKKVAIGSPVEDELSFKRQPHGQASNEPSTGQPNPPLPPKHSEPASLYMLRHFPQERPPVPAAPYVGGVEWEATNYLASHLDLVNAILSCIPSTAERNLLRSQMRMSGWERCMGSSLRLCKEKFYGAVHDGLRVWVAAAYEDGWDVRDVRYGPPPPPQQSTERRSNSPKKKVSANGAPKTDESAPKLEIPKLDFVLDGEGL